MSDAEIPRGRGEPGTWEPCMFFHNGDHTNPYWGAVVWCATCRLPLVLVLHNIDDRGQVTPSIGHPSQYPPCAWHPTPRLIGWTPHKWPFPQPTTCERCGARSLNLGGWGTWSRGTGLICEPCNAAHLQEVRGPLPGGAR